MYVNNKNITLNYNFVRTEMEYRIYVRTKFVKRYAKSFNNDIVVVVVL